MEHIHFIGIGGTGLSAIAKVLLEEGYQVSGSDLVLSNLSESVEASGGVVFEGHRAENIQGADLVIRSSAIPDDNSEVTAALKTGIPVLKRSEFLGRMMESKRVIAVAGSHGKTTTTSLLSWILTCLDQDPSFIVGGVVENLKTNARAGKGKDFVIEADEYDNMFLGLNPDLALITNIEYDHPDIFPSEESFEFAFESFVKRLSPDGTLIICSEDPGAMKMAALISPEQHLISYGLEGSEADYWARDIKYHMDGGCDFELQIGREELVQSLQLSILLPGEHNVLNAVGAFAAADQLGLDRREIVRAIGLFQGSERRFDIRGEFQGIYLIDDYAHHPTEIRSTLAAARSVYPGRRILSVWQPHTYSRIQALEADFKEVFSGCDQVIVLDVYAAREKKPPDFSLSRIVNEIKGVEAIQISGKAQAVQYLRNTLVAGDVLLVFSAGDAIEITQELEGLLSARNGNQRGE